MFFERRCVVCGEGADLVCASCTARLRPLEPRSGADRRSCFELEPTIREVVAALKYRRERRLANWAAERLAALVPRNADMVTWCPATPSRERRRGFDQGRELARAVAGCTGLPLRRLLRRSAGDGRQTGRTRDERAFGPSLMPVGHPGQLVVLVDDITTTGATLDAAQRVLFGAGADRVVAVTLAATPRRAR